MIVRIPARLVTYARVLIVLLAVVVSETRSDAVAQGTRTTVQGQVVMAGGQEAAGAQVALRDVAGTTIATTRTDAAGHFALADVAPGFYKVHAFTADFTSPQQLFWVTSAAPVEMNLTLAVGIDPPMIVTASVDTAAGTQTMLAGEFVRQQPGRLQSRALAQALAALPGWTDEDNGLLHVRGVDDGVLFVEDGVPVYDRTDVAFGLPPALSSIGTVTVITGHMPAEFGLKSGAVVEVFTPPATGRWHGESSAGVGSTATTAFQGAAGGPLARGIEIGAGVSAERSARFLDPVHPDNLHNTGGVGAASLRASWARTANAVVRATASAGRSRFDVPHGQVQEAAGQDQRQQVAQQAQALSWQQMLGAGAAAHLAGYHRRVDATLRGSAEDTPLTAASDRRHDRLGALGSVSYAMNRHDLKAGGEMARLSLREDFAFATTDDDAAEAAGLSPGARAFTPDAPFVFAGRVARTQWSAYVQDHVPLTRGLTLDAGLRVDRTELLLPATQWSPRLGAAYGLPGSHTTARASFNRFFQPPQPEHLLLSSSAQARALSPFATDDDGDGGGAEVPPERQSAWEVGLEHWFAARVRVDVAAWRRDVRNYADPNVFFGTTIVFPNSVASGTARGLDLRVEVPRRGAWSGAATYTVSKVQQTGPINGGLFLEDDLDEIGPGVTFTPDHDQRHTASATVTWARPASRFAGTALTRYVSGTPIEVGDLDEEEAAALAKRPGVALVDPGRGRVRPRLVLDLAMSARLSRAGRNSVSLRASVLNAINRAYAFNFGNPFSGTHFGTPRQFRVDARISFD